MRIDISTKPFYIVIIIYLASVRLLRCKTIELGHIKIKYTYKHTYKHESCV